METSGRGAIASCELCICAANDRWCEGKCGVYSNVRGGGVASQMLLSLCRV